MRRPPDATAHTTLLLQHTRRRRITELCLLFYAQLLEHVCRYRGAFVTHLPCSRTAVVSGGSRAIRSEWSACLLLHVHVCGVPLPNRRQRSDTAGAESQPGLGVLGPTSCPALPSWAGLERVDRPQQRVQATPQPRLPWRVKSGVPATWMPPAAAGSFAHDTSPEVLVGAPFKA